MSRGNPKSLPAPRGLPKTPTGIEGVDLITGGGLPTGRPTLVCGAAGCGKTLFAIEFLIRGATEFGEPGAFISFEETSEELSANVRSLGFALDVLSEKKLVAVDYVRVERSELEENGEYDLDGLFLRLGYAIDSIGAKRVVLDTLETLFGGLPNESILRSELRRLFRWLKDRGVTAVVTAERGDGKLTRSGLEEYVSDCVILLDHRVVDQVCTRRLRIVKYRGTAHGTNEYPFLIEEAGISVLPITRRSLDVEVSSERISSGIPRLDEMLGGAGPYRGSTVLLSGTAGTGKSSLAAQFVNASAKRKERCLYFAFEESASQITRNMRSIGLDLEPWVRKKLLRFVTGRPTLTGLETHLALMHREVRQFAPRLVVVDPISNLEDAGNVRDASALLVRLIDFLKSQQITAIFTSLTRGSQASEATDVGVSSVVDTWLLLRDIELGGERNRALYVLKSRGMAHSNQIREFLLTGHGIELLDVYVGPEGVLTGSMRVAQEARERATEQQRKEAVESELRAFGRKRQELESRIEGLRAELAEEQAALAAVDDRERERGRLAVSDRSAIARSRKSDARPSGRRGNGKQGTRA